MTNMLLQPGSPAFLALCLAGWFLLVNSLTVVAFRVDQRRAMEDDWRVPQKTLLLMAALGGWPGAKLAQLSSRFKAHRMTFRVLLNLSALPLAGLIGYIAAQDVDWRGMIAPAPVETADVSAPAPPPKPEVRDFSKPSATKAPSVTDNADLPKRIGPGPGKVAAWHSR